MLTLPVLTETETVAETDRAVYERVCAQLDAKLRASASDFMCWALKMEDKGHTETARYLAHQGLAHIRHDESREAEQIRDVLRSLRARHCPLCHGTGMATWNSEEKEGAPCSCQEVW